MASYLHKAYLNTTAGIDLLDATHDVKRALRDSQVLNGLMTVFIPGSTAGVVVLENDPQIKNAYKELILAFVPDSGTKVRPVRKSGTGSTEAHLRSALMSASVNIPIKDGKLLLGAWQEVIVYDFEDKPGRREILITVFGDGAPEPKK